MLKKMLMFLPHLLIRIIILCHFKYLLKLFYIFCNKNNNGYVCLVILTFYLLKGITNKNIDIDIAILTPKH